MKIFRQIINRIKLNLTSINKVKVKDIAVFARQFHAMLNAGVTLIHCLNILGQQTENLILREAIEKIYEDVQKGFALSDAMGKHRDIFPELFINMVDAGEVSGNLDTIMDRMASHYEKEAKLQTKIRDAAIYPIILALVSSAVVVFMLTAILPSFVNMFESSGVNLPVPTLVLLRISNGLRQHWYFFIIVLFVVILIVDKYANTDIGKKKLDELKLRVPILRNTIIIISASRFARTLSILLSSGIPLLTAMDIISKVIGNRVLSDGLLNVKEDLRKGFDLSGSVQRLNLLPPMVNAMIRIGEESGSLDEIMKKTADFYDYEVEAAMQRLTALLEPLMIIIMAVIIGFLIIAMYLPMIDMIITI